MDAAGALDVRGLDHGQYGHGSFHRLAAGLELRGRAAIQRDSSSYPVLRRQRPAVFLNATRRLAPPAAKVASHLARGLLGTINMPASRLAETDTTMRLFRLWRLQDVRLLMSALRSPTRPWWLWPVTILLVLFAIEPANFGLPALGIVDDLLLLPLLLRLVVKLSGADRLQFMGSGRDE